MTTSARAEVKNDWDKVVIHLESEVVKGFLEVEATDSLDHLLLSAANGMPRSLRIRRIGLDVVEEIPTEKAKAIFYVKEFDGDAGRKDLHFYKRAPLMHRIWVRIEFVDGEVLEGMVQNTIRFL